jgi:hypothetical protein
MNGPHIAAEAIMRRVQRVTPTERQDWARAMAAELVYMPSSALGPLLFAFGCLWAALRLRAQPLYRQVRDEMVFGCVVGALFFAHAAFPGSLAWPLIWPAAGGAIAVSLNRKTGRARSSLLRTGAITAATSATAFFLGGVGLLLWVGAPDLESRVPVVLVGAGLGMLISAATGTLAALCMRGPRSSDLP